MASFDHFSRRALIGSAAAALALMPSLAHAGTPPAPTTGSRIPDNALPPLPPETEHIQGRTDISKRLTVEGMINGKGPYRFIVDTGADRTVIAYELAQDLGLLKGQDVIVQGISRALPAPTVTLNTVSVGSIVLENVVAPVLRRDWLGADGYLGLDIIDGRRVVFDFMHHSMTVGASGGWSSWANHDEAIVKARGDNGRLIAVNCSVDRVSAHAFVDSGAEISIGNSLLFDRLREERGAQYLTDVAIPLIGVTGGLVQGRIVAVNEVKVGDLSFNKTLLVIADLDIFKAWSLDNQPAMFIGMNFLKQLSALTIDYRRKELRFKLAQATLIARV